MTLHEAYLEAKDRHDDLDIPNGIAWGVAIKEIAFENDVDVDKLRNYIATEIGKNRNRSTRNLLNANKAWTDAMADGKLTDLTMIHSKFDAGLINRKNAMKKWAREIVADESVDEITRYKIKTKYKV